MAFLLPQVVQSNELFINGVPFRMIPVQGGTFTMGATAEQGSDVQNNELPVHQVTLNGFLIGETEVTQQLWQAVMGQNPSNFTGDIYRPVEMVSWKDCQTFITELNLQTGINFRLPTEAEWEFAARGGNKSQGYKYAGSNTLEDVAWYDNNSNSTTHPVATKASNELGLYDMSGNVWEWCQDWFGSYSNANQTNPTGPSSGSGRISRGGSWVHGNNECRVSYRNSGSPVTTIRNYIGLRLACDLVMATSITMHPEELTMIVGHESELTPITSPYNSLREFDWISSDTNIVDVDSNGRLKAKMTGVANITATTIDGSNLSVTCTITVINPNEEDENEFTINGVPFKMIPVQGGTFTMGATSEQVSDARYNEYPTHQVTLSDYKIGETEVTQALWQAVMGDNPSNFTGDLQHPVDQVSWNECQTFVSRLRQLTGMNFRLPTEAEWEYAARGGNKSQGFKYAGSNNIDDVAWYTDNSNSNTHPVATKAPNELGLYDMSGNVYEWCQDKYGYYSGDSQTNPTGSVSDSYRTHRGGGWYDIPKYCRVSVRFHADPTHKEYVLGLRLACDPIRAASITIQPQELSMFVGQESELNAVITPSIVSSQQIEWSSSDTAVVEIDNYGKVIARAPGAAVIIATTTDGSRLSDTCMVTVSELKATSIIVEPDSVVLDIGGSIRLQTTITPEGVAGQLLRWDSSNDEVAIVSSNGLIYAVGAGQALIIATTTDGSDLSDTCYVTVQVPFELSAQTVAAPVNTLRNIPIAIDNHVPGKSFAMTILVPDSIQYYSDAMPGPRCNDFNVTTTYNTDSTVMRIEGVMTAQPMAAGTGTFLLLPIKSSKYIANFDILMTDITFTSTNDGVGTQELDDITVTLHVLDLGDVNGDKVVDISDVNTLINYILGKQSDLTNFGVGDINNDGVIDISDVNAVINIILGKG